MNSDSFDDAVGNRNVPEHDEAVSACSPVLPLDVDKYRKHVEDFDLSDAQQTELLQTLWSIMRSFVEVGFGVDSIHHFVPEIGAIAADTGENAVKSEDSEHANAFQRVAGDGSIQKEES